MQDVSASILVQIKAISNQECPNTGSKGSLINGILTSAYSIDGNTGTGRFWMKELSRNQSKIITQYSNKKAKKKTL